ncbi:hypothetical protein MPEAHAMD_7207 [Methylobacterium frigidaeris]|uniref:Uncharacterized protein n=1 Tax=Methylobacterium frigidaeris TaxID=2038277 RepID=A0AA37HJF7_9HYPH|nr:hypothetical protein MPEAHAMD_7207 [Methylobacterium frigidaeris]
MALPLYGSATPTAWIARDSDDTARDCPVAKACEFAASWSMLAFVSLINRRIGAKPRPARDAPPDNRTLGLRLDQHQNAMRAAMARAEAKLRASLS